MDLFWTKSYSLLGHLCDQSMYIWKHLIQCHLLFVILRTEDPERNQNLTTVSGLWRAVFQGTHVPKDFRRYVKRVTCLGLALFQSSLCIIARVLFCFFFLKMQTNQSVFQKIIILFRLRVFAVALPFAWHPACLLSLLCRGNTETQCSVALRTQKREPACLRLNPAPLLISWANLASHIPSFLLSFLIYLPLRWRSLGITLHKVLT